MSAETTQELVERILAEERPPTGDVGHDEMTASGASYRQIDHWTRIGYLEPIPGTAGTGHRRRWPRTERAVADLMYRLCCAGIPPAVAHQVARAGGDCELAPGIRVTITDP